MILYMGYSSFTLCEILELSGVISALVTGVLLAHYNFYNMSPIGKISS
jgi:sodium/hydrogen exchanger-like protein 6/7/sodium/hydrogen exchanger 8